MHSGIVAGVWKPRILQNMSTDGDVSNEDAQGALPELIRW